MQTIGTPAELGKAADMLWTKNDRKAGTMKQRPSESLKVG